MSSDPSGCIGCLAVLATPFGIYYAVSYAIGEARKAKEAEEAEKRRLEAAEQQRVREARERQIQLKRQALVKAGDVVYVAAAPHKWVRCPNRHRYRFDAFQIDTGDYYYRMGYHLDKSIDFVFEDNPHVDFRVCDQCKCGYQLDKYPQGCPSCAAAR